MKSPHFLWQLFDKNFIIAQTEYQLFMPNFLKYYETK